MFEFFRESTSPKKVETIAQPIDTERQAEQKEKEFKPIHACLVDVHNIDKQTQKTIDRIKKEGIFIDYDGGSYFYAKNNIKNAGIGTYVISQCDDKDKWSTRYWDCTGIVAVAEDKETGKQISFISHQSPEGINEEKDKFINDLAESFSDLRDRTQNVNIDVVVFGGHGNLRKYLDSIKSVGAILHEEFNIEPTIMTGPNFHQKLSDPLNNPTEGYFDTQNRRLYIVRPPQESEANENYLPHELDKQRDKWDKVT